jgi:LAO/AO transport system kinase
LTLEELIGGALAGDRVALARVITLIERDAAAARRIDAAMGPRAQQAFTIGFTGAPGAGKSTLVGALLEQSLADDRRVAVLALDPVSPISRGAILGDRLRMERPAADARVFVRSMTAGAHGGGLAVVTPLVIRALDAAGWPWIVVETVGVGQSELDIAEAAATTIVVVNPGWGDEVQAVKAGLLEVADIFVINKSDRDGAAETRRDLESLATAAAPDGWRTPILDTVAHRGIGIGALWPAIEAHRDHLTRTGLLAARRRRFLALAVKGLVGQALQQRVEELAAGDDFARLLGQADGGDLSLHAAGDIALQAVLDRPAAP